MEKDKTRLQIERKARAEAILNNPLHEEAFSNLKESIVKSWATCDIHDKDAQAFYHAQICSLDLIKQYYETIIQNGRIAEQKIKIAPPKQSILKKVI